MFKLVRVHAPIEKVPRISFLGISYSALSASQNYQTASQAKRAKPASQTDTMVQVAWNTLST